MPFLVAKFDNKQSYIIPFLQVVIWDAIKHVIKLRNDFIGRCYGKMWRCTCVLAVFARKTMMPNFVRRLHHYILFQLSLKYGGRYVLYFSLLQQILSHHTFFLSLSLFVSFFLLLFFVFFVIR